MLKANFKLIISSIAYIKLLIGIQEGPQDHFKFKNMFYQLYYFKFYVQ